MEYKKPRAESSCVCTMCLLRTMFIIWLSIDIYSSLVFVISDICVFWLLLSSVGVSWGCWSAEENIGSSHKHSIGWLNFGFEMPCNQRNFKSLKKHVVHLFLEVFWIPFCKSLSITITLWVLTSHFCLNHNLSGIFNSSLSHFGPQNINLNCFFSY